MALWRFEADGDPDPGFGGTGYVVSNGAAGGSGEDIGVGVVLDGRAAPSSRATARTRARDVRSPSTAMGGTAAGDGGRDVLVDGTGKLVVAGFSGNASGNRDLVVWRVNP